MKTRKNNKKNKNQKTMNLKRKRTRIRTRTRTFGGANSRHDVVSQRKKRILMNKIQQFRYMRNGTLKDSVLPWLLNHPMSNHEYNHILSQIQDKSLSMNTDYAIYDLLYRIKTGNDHTDKENSDEDEIYSDSY
jgi:hypothetical protein